MSGLTFRNMYQMGFVVRDAERASAHIGKRFGIKKFRILRHSAEITTVHAYVGDMMIELIQASANGPSYFVNHIPDDPEAAVFHHHAYRVFDEAEWASISGAVDSSGLPSFRNTAMNGDLRVIFVDCRRELGVYAEYVFLTGAARNYYDDVPRN